MGQGCCEVGEGDGKVRVPPLPSLCRSCSSPTPRSTRRRQSCPSTSAAGRRGSGRCCRNRQGPMRAGGWGGQGTGSPLLAPEPALPAGGASYLRHPRLRGHAGKQLQAPGRVAVLRQPGGRGAPLRGVPLHAGHPPAGKCVGSRKQGGLRSPPATPFLFPSLSPHRLTTLWWSWRRTQGWRRRWTRHACGSSPTSGRRSASTHSSPPPPAPEQAHTHPPRIPLAAAPPCDSQK